MKKMQLLIILPMIMAFLAFMDYFVTRPGLNLPDNPTLNPAAQEVINDPNTGSSLVPPAIPTQINLTKAVLEKDPGLSIYSLEKTTRSADLFEKFDLSQTSLMAYKNRLIDPKGANPPLIIYELQAAKGQGKFNYLNLKLAMTNQLSPQAELNATNEYGQSSLFYNHSDNPSTGFLVTQINDTIFGFQYPKNSPSAFLYIQNFLKSLNTAN